VILLAIPAGLEPATRGVEIRYSIQLSYGTVFVTVLMTVLAGTAAEGGRAVHLHNTANMKNLLFRQAGSEPFSATNRQS
jgi:hypothetical protein